MNSLSSLSQTLHELDATGYFFVSSGLFIGITAFIFFLFGLWVGRKIWGRYGKRSRSAEALVDTLKNENAQLKVRIADLSARPGTAVPNLSLSFAPDPASPAPAETIPALPAGIPFTLWTEAGWQPSVPSSPPSLPAGQPFTVWTEDPPARTTRIADFLPSVSQTLSPSAETDSPFPQPPSQAFCLWTEADLVSATPERRPVAASSAFTLWTTLEQYAAPLPPLPALLPPPSHAFSVWTSPDWQPTSLAPLPLGIPFTLWTRGEPESHSSAQSSAYHPPSNAFTLWTAGSSDSSFPATPHIVPTHTQLVAAAANAVRSIVSKHPSPADTWSHATLGTPAPIGPLLPPSQAFTLWTQRSAAASSITQRAALAALIRGHAGHEDAPAAAPAFPPSPVIEPLPFIQLDDDQSRIPV